MEKRKRYTDEEVKLCVYAALYDPTDFGGLERVSGIEGRNKKSIEKKVQNIVSMCDENGIRRNPAVSALTGKTTGEYGRRTNWDVLQKYVSLPRETFLEEVLQILSGT